MEKFLEVIKVKVIYLLLKICFDFVVCLVKDLLDFVRFVKLYNVDLLVGYLVRIVVEYCRVLDKNIGYLVVYERMKYYLLILRIYVGEMLYSFRLGCVIMMILLGLVERVD